MIKIVDLCFINMNFLYVFIYFCNFNDIKTILYICDMLQNFFIESNFPISIKTFLIEVMSRKTFWIEAMLQETVPN